MPRWYSLLYKPHPNASLQKFSRESFDPVNDPSEAGAIYTNYGWFYIPARYYLNSDIINVMNRELELSGADNNTPPEEIQDFIYDWCIWNPPLTRIRPKKQKKDEESLERLFNDELHIEESEHQKRKELLNDKLKSKLKTDEDEPAKKPKSKTKAKEKVDDGRKRELRFRFNEETGKYDISGKITLIHAWTYFKSKSYDIIKNGGTYAEIGKMWKSLPQEEQEKLRSEYTQLLKDGFDSQRGENVPLTTRLGEAQPDGYRPMLALTPSQKRAPPKTTKSKQTTKD
ncbi:hypothetical protein G210_4735 [Candida maltosa Xu316]|uniref:Uncharacterized protein n=1 Tax=Candida maltosa (strain Xu316) TaxID=1245528 RepID=M3K612_CANMX|nr:hypothetical protein G210_4735 [Candida maltosa Xu316]